MATVLTETPKLRIEIEQSEGMLLIRPVGAIDEDVNCSVILDCIKNSPGLQVLQFDMEHISRINSCGVREWILLMERLPSTLKLEFVRVNEIFLDQANIIPTMLGKRGTNSQIVSFYAPYHCPACNLDMNILLQPSLVVVKAGHPEAPRCTCANCGGPLEFDWLDDEYFGFVKRVVS